MGACTGTRIAPEYPLSYDDLKNGEFYVTEYLGQGKYTFKNGYPLWKLGSLSPITKNNGNFTPENGFTAFRKATEEEIKSLQS